MRLDTLPSQPKDRVTSEEGSEQIVLEGAAPNEINLGALPSQPVELKLPPEEPGKEVPISKGEMFDVQLTTWANRMMKYEYGEQALKDAVVGQKRLDFFMSRAPRVALAFAAPLYSLAYEAWDQGVNVLVSQMKDEKYDPLERRAISELLPDKAPTIAKVAANLTETLVSVALIGGAMNLAREGTLKSALKELGGKLEQAGYGTAQQTLSQEAIRKAARGTTLERAAKIWLKVKKMKVSALNPATRGAGGVVKTPIMDKEMRVIRPVFQMKAAPTKGIEGAIKGVAPLWLSQGAIAERPSVGQAIFAIDIGKLDPAKLSPGHKVKKYFTYTENIPKEAIIVKVVETEDEVSATQKLGAILKEKNIQVENVMFHTGADVEVLKPDFGRELKPPIKVPPAPKPKPKYKKPTPAKLITSQSRYAELLGLKKMVGPLEIGKMKYNKELGELSNQIDHVIKKLVSLKTVTSEEMAVLLNTNVEAPKDLGEKETEIFNFFRALTRDILARENQVREELGMDPIKDIGAYFRHIGDATAADVLAGRTPVPQKVKEWAAKNISSKVYNPMEIERKLKDEFLKHFSKDLGYVMKSMLRVGLKEIHMAEAKQFLTDELAAAQIDPKILEKMGAAEKAEYLQKHEMPKETKEWLTDYVNIVLLGEQQTKMDVGANLWITDGPIGPLLNKVLAPFGKQISKTPLTDAIVTVSKLPLYGVLGPFNPRQIIRNKMQPIQSMALYGVKATIKGFLPTSDFPMLEKLKTDSLFLNTYSGIEGMPTSLMGKLEKFNFAAFQWSAKSNVSQAMNAAYHWTAEKIQDPKYKAQGFADPQRTYTEDKNFFYPSEQEKLLKEMEYGAHTTQYGYLALHMPEAFRYKAIAGFTRLNSWWMNHIAIFHREAATRAFTGRMGDDPDIRLSVADRINYLKYLVIGGLVLNTLGYERSFLLGTAPTALPPSAQLALGLYTYFTHRGDSDYEKNKRREAGDMIKSSAMTFIPGYLTIKDITALLTGEKSWTEYLFYKKQKARKTFRRS